MASILLADDDAATRDLVRRALESEGHVVCAVPDGAEAMERLEDSGTLDLLVTDIEMPGVDGIALATAALGGQAGLKVVLMSGYAAGMDRASALTGARVATIMKPFTLEQIRALVRSVLA